MVKAFAGINMSGNFYVPLDTKSPNNRILSILQVLEAELIITDKAHEQQIKGNLHASWLHSPRSYPPI